LFWQFDASSGGFHGFRTSGVNMNNTQTYSAFSGDRRIANGELKAMLLQVKEIMDKEEAQPLVFFEDQTGRQLDFDLRGTSDEILGRLAMHPHFAQSIATPAGPGRPKLGVISREVSLLPRHWEWLEEQPGGISANLRTLVEKARKSDPGKQRIRSAQDAANRFMTALAGNYAGYEEATRALFALDLARFRSIIQPWPKDIRAFLEPLVQVCEGFAQEPSASVE
jgi:uncharacterized protein